MVKFNTYKKGVALLMVLTLILVVVILANVVLSIISSQSRLTHHEVSRIRAYYAARAGMILAFDRLRTGTWGTGRYTLCRANCNINDPDIPYPVTINISSLNNTTGVRTITITTNYTYNP
jgi:Tfp pilus assembly protein PilX